MCTLPLVKAYRHGLARRRRRSGVGGSMGEGVSSGVATSVGAGSVGVEIAVVAGLAELHGGVGSGVDVSMVGEFVGVCAGVSVGVGVADGVTVVPGVGCSEGELLSRSEVGEPLKAASAELLLVSVALPAAPPGLRSRLDDAGGAAPAVPSTKLLDASPHLSESITAPPTTRRTPCSRPSPTARRCTVPSAAAA